MSVQTETVDDYESFDHLLRAIESPDQRQRDHAALHAQDLAEALVDALFRTVARLEYRHHNGTLVHVLQTFNCEDRFTELFDLALNGDYEVQCPALSILQRQSFNVTNEQLRWAEQALSLLREREHLSAENVELLRAELRCVLRRLGESTNDASQAGNSLLVRKV